MKTLAILLAIVAAASCGDPSSPGVNNKVFENPKLQAGLVASGLHDAPPQTDSSATIAAFRTGSDDEQVVYVTMLPGTLVAGTRATLQSKRIGATVDVYVVNGGFDPTPVPAEVGDTIVVTVEQSGAPSATASIVVAGGKPPRIVRTNPPKGAIDVPVNRSLAVIVSEPVDSNSVSNAVVTLFDGETQVSGTVRVHAAAGYIVEFTPAESLERGTTYTLRVGDAITNKLGEPIEAGATVSFTTTAFNDPPLSFKAISTAVSHACALTHDGTPYCWGENRYGELGDGTVSSSTSPVRVATNLKFDFILASGRLSCGITANNDAYCWGHNFGLFGNGTTTSALLPVRAAPSLKLAALSIASGHACGLTTDSEVYCWGYSKFAAIGAPVHCTNDMCTEPVRIASSDRFQSVDVGAYTVCGLTISRQALCWGTDLVGELGIANLELFPTCPALVDLRDRSQPARCSPTPVLVETEYQFAKVYSGGFFHCGMLDDGAMICWGGNNTGQFGNGQRTEFQRNPVPVPAANGIKFSVFATGNQRACGISIDGITYCWGGYSGFTTEYVPEPVPDAPQFVTVSTELIFSCGLDTNGRAYCWGDNKYGSLGNGTFVSSKTPVAVIGP